MTREFAAPMAATSRTGGARAAGAGSVFPVSAEAVAARASRSRGKAGGGGLIGLLVIAAIIILPRLLGGGSGSQATSTPEAEQDQGGQGGGRRRVSVRDRADSVRRVQRRRQEYWVRQYPQSFPGAEYEATEEMVWFDGSVDTACRGTSSQTGPFYCPADRLVYLDIEFLEELQSQFGADGATWRPRYIVAHELGHHVQALNGTNAIVQSASGERQRLLGDRARAPGRLLRPAAWVNDADRRRNAAGEDLIDQSELSEALNAAAAVGDDAIQRQTQGRVVEDSFTHGSVAEQRESWFRRGYEHRRPHSVHDIRGGALATDGCSR